jgi:acyl carrier protein
VADRFGDYGLVGLVLYETEADRFRIVTFLLSCRVLGRGVEHRVLSSISQRAVSAGKRFVELICLPTERNLPAREFVDSLSEEHRTRAGESSVFPAEYLANLQSPDEKSQQSTDRPTTPSTEKTVCPAPFGFDAIVRSDQLQQIGEELYDICRVTKAIDKFRLNAQILDGVAEREPSSTMENVIANIWRRVLGRPGMPLNLNFFEAGGTSLKAVQVIGMIGKELKRNISIVSLFECPTVKLLAARLSAKAGGLSIEPNAARAALRGQQRRSMAVRRTRSE